MKCSEYSAPSLQALIGVFLKASVVSPKCKGICTHQVLCCLLPCCCVPLLPPWLADISSCIGSGQEHPSCWHCSVLPSCLGLPCAASDKKGSTNTFKLLVLHKGSSLPSALHVTAASLWAHWLLCSRSAPTCGCRPLLAEALPALFSLYSVETSFSFITCLCIYCCLQWSATGTPSNTSVPLQHKQNLFLHKLREKRQWHLQLWGCGV